MPSQPPYHGPAHVQWWIGMRCIGRETPQESVLMSNTVTDGSTTSYEITDLFGVSRYNVTVRATNAAGSAVSNEFYITTTEAGSTNSLCVAPCS